VLAIAIAISNLVPENMCLVCLASSPVWVCLPVYNMCVCVCVCICMHKNKTLELDRRSRSVIFHRAFFICKSAWRDYEIVYFAM
jgi:hypothetical protein